MRVALLSDIHGNLPALHAVVADIARRGADQIVNLGDSLSGPLQPLETAEYLMAESWVHLAGNHERQVLTIPPAEQGASDHYAHSQLTPSALAWMTRLTPTLSLTPEIFLCHGTPSCDSEYLLETVDGPRLRAASAAELEARLGSRTEEVVACGHSHVPRVVRTRRGQLLVNPGSVGLPAYEAHHPHYYTVENGSPDARYAIIEREHGSWRTQLIVVPYQHSTSASYARARGRHDWELALTHGYLS